MTQRREKASDMRPVAGYVRVSTAGQMREGASVETQERVIRGYADLHYPCRKLVVFRDVGSGTNELRPGYQELTRDVRRRRFQAVISWSHDRLCRNVGQFAVFIAQIERSETALILHTSGLATFNAAGRAFLQILAAFAQYESSVTGERVAAVWQDRKRRGLKGPGYRPFGWRADAEGVLHEDAAEQAALRVALASLAQGRNWREIAEILNASGARPVKAPQWTSRNARLAVLAASRRLRDPAEAGRIR